MKNKYNGAVSVIYSDGNSKQNERTGMILVITNTYIKLAVEDLILKIQRDKIDSIKQL